MGAAAAVSAANIAAMHALLYVGRSEQTFARMQTLHAQRHGDSRDCGEQHASQHGPKTKGYSTGQLRQSEPADKQDDDCQATTSRCLWLPTPPPKYDKHGLERQLSPSLRFISLQREHGRSVLICDDEGVDACVCVALAAMLGRDAADTDWAASNSACSVSAVVHRVKAAARTRLAELSGFHPIAQPTRTALKQVYSFVSWMVSPQSRTSATAGLQI